MTTFFNGSGPPRSAFPKVIWNIGPLKCSGGKKNFFRSRVSFVWESSCTALFRGKKERTNGLKNGNIVQKKGKLSSVMYLWVIQGRGTHTEDFKISPLFDKDIPLGERYLQKHLWRTPNLF